MAAWNHTWCCVPKFPSFRTTARQLGISRASTPSHNCASDPIRYPPTRRAWVRIAASSEGHRPLGSCHLVPEWSGDRNRSLISKITKFHVKHLKLVCWWLKSTFKAVPSRPWRFSERTNKVPCLEDFTSTHFFNSLRFSSNRPEGGQEPSSGSSSPAAEAFSSCHHWKSSE